MVRDMKALFITISLLILTSLHLLGQKLGPYLISTSGQQYQTESISLYASIGEPINTYESDGDVNVSQGVLQSILNTGTEGLQSCVSNTGRMFFENCDDGTEFFFIEDQNGTILDPYFGEGVEFSEQNGITVNFGYRPADFASPCSQAEQAIELTCVEEAVTTSTDDFIKKGNLSIYPNPSNGQIFINRIDLQEEVRSMKMYDALGRLVWEEANRTILNNDEIEINIKGLSNGLYHLQFLIEGGLISERIIIERG